MKNPMQAAELYFLHWVHTECILSQLWDSMLLLSHSKIFIIIFSYISAEKICIGEKQIDTLTLHSQLVNTAVY